MSNMIAHRISHHYFNKSHYVTRELGVPLEISDFAWELHYISFGFMFALIAVLTLFNVVGFVRDDRQKKFQRRHYFTWMNGALFYFSTIMAVALLGDPWEDRRYIISRKYRETLRLIVRLRMPALSVAFSLIQVSLLSVTEVVLYGTTWFHSFAIICILNSIQLTLVVVSTVVTMFVPSSTSHVWLICDIYMFLFFAANSLISLYTGAKILQNYKDKSENKFRKVVSSSSSWYRNQYGNVNSTNDAVFINDTNRVTINVETRDNNGVIGSITESETGSDGHNTAFVIAERNEMQRQRTNMTSVSSDGFSSFRDEDIPFPIRAEENQMKRPSLYPIYVDNEKNKTIVQKRRIGSLPYQTRSSKFCDKSIRKVSALMMVVAVFGIVMCCTIMMALYTADIVTDEQIGPVHWYTLRTVRRISEIGVTGTMAYMIRRPYHCFCCCQ